MDAAGYREAVYDAFAGTEADLSERVARGLSVGTEYLGLSIGFLTRIEDGTQFIQQSVGDHPAIRAGESCPLDEAYCRRTIEVDGSLAVQDADSSPDVAERAVEAFGLVSYVGAKVVVGESVYGTVCFADVEGRDEPFSETESVFVELLAKLVGQALERRDYERELRERNRRLAAEKRRFEGIAENSFDVLFRVDDGGEFTYVSTAVERVLGHAPAVLEGEQFTDFVAEWSVPDAGEAYAALLDRETVESLELDFLGADGETVTLEVNATPVTDDGEVVGVEGVGRDVTARKERQRELRLKNRAIDDADVGVVITDPTRPNNPVVYANEGFSRLTGYPASAVLDRQLDVLYGDATDPDAADEVRTAVAAERSASTELVTYRADGTPFWSHLRVNPVTDEAGTVTHFLGFQTDVTERKRTEKLLALLNRVLRHNLRNDMNTILGYSALLADDPAVDADGYASRIRDTAETLVGVSERARELERYARRERDPVRLDPATLLEDVATVHREQFPDATIEVRADARADLCAGVELRRALVELVENALKHDPDGDTRVTLSAASDGDWVAVTVADDGPGIEAMEAAVVARGAETDLQHGSGLGLWLVNWIVTRYGGSFQVRPAEGGTVATIRLPALPAGASVDDVVRRPTVLFR